MISTLPSSSPPSASSVDCGSVNWSSSWPRCCLALSQGLQSSIELSYYLSLADPVFGTIWLSSFRIGMLDQPIGFVVGVYERAEFNISIIKQEASAFYYEERWQLRTSCIRNKLLHSAEYVKKVRQHNLTQLGNETKWKPWSLISLEKRSYTILLPWFAVNISSQSSTGCISS